ncbi:MAG TPA: inorganic diphosphatase [Thermodesulfobacteriota bacterium]|nr:inorganic diphosphatase [Candidatus Paceibacterota bacterium]HVY54453.1 inorganic diphosphatase [Thermodesulfobacteriota bacterium]
MNILHSIAPGTDDSINVIVEIPKGSKNKYEIDKATGLIALDRVLHTAQDFPYDYGFVPQTLWHDGDPLDVVLLTTHALFPGVLVRVRPVALLHMTDSGDRDDKLIAVPCDDPRWNDVQDLADLNKHTLLEIEHFYSTYKKLQNKEVIVKHYKGKKEAIAAFKEAIELYKKANKGAKAKK